MKANYILPLTVGWVNKMKKNNFLHLFFLVIIFISMLGIIFIGRQLVVSNKDYQPTTKSIKTKAASKTYSKLLTLNQPSPTLTNKNIGEAVNQPTPTISIQPEEEKQTPTPTKEFILEENQLTPTPTEIILAKNLSPTEIEKITPSNTPKESLPESGNYQNFLFLFGFSLAIVFLSFVL